MRRILLPFVIIVALVFIVLGAQKEGFGTSPGTMVQLQTSHVPTQEDADFYMNVYPRVVRRDITDLTGDDPGMLRPWIFPWYGRGVTLIH